MTDTLLHDARTVYLEKARSQARHWSGYVDHLLEAFHASGDPTPLLQGKMEALRNKRDTVLTKVHALEHHVRKGWPEAKRELEKAQHEMREAWRSVVSALEREGMFV